MALGIVDPFRSSPVLGDLMSLPRPSSSSRLWCPVNLYETSPSAIVRRQKRTSGCHFSFETQKQTPLSTKGLRQKLLKRLPWMEPRCTSSRLTPDVVEETLRQGLSVPRVLITLPLAALHNNPRDTAAVVQLLPRNPLTSERTNEHEAHVASQAPVSGTADGDRASAFTKHPAPRIGQTDLLAPAQRPAVAGGCVARHVTFRPRPSL